MFISPAVENMVLGMDKEVWEIADTSRDIVRTQGEWELLGINKATLKMSVGSSLFDQIMFYVRPEHGCLSPGSPSWESSKSQSLLVFAPEPESPWIL